MLNFNNNNIQCVHIFFVSFQDMPYRGSSELFSLGAIFPNFTNGSTTRILGCCAELLTSLLQNLAQA